MDDIRITLTHPDLMPLRQRAGDAGADLKAAEWRVIQPGKSALVSTGVSLAIPYGYAGFVFLRADMRCSALVNDVHGTLLMNKFIVINHQDRRIVHLPIRNIGENPVDIRGGDILAQLVVLRIELPGFDVVKDLPQTARDAGGFGSRGV